MWDARLLGLLLPKFTQHHHFIFGLVGVREGNLRPPQSNGCWQLLQYLMTLMRSRRHRQLWCSTSFKTIAKMREKGNSKHVIEYNCDTISKIAVWATFLCKSLSFSFLVWPSTHCGKRPIFVKKFNFHQWILDWISKKCWLWNSNSPFSPFSPCFKNIEFFNSEMEFFHSVICILLCITNLNIFVI